MIALNTKILCLIGCLLFSVSACSSADPLLRPTGKAAFVPADNVPFTRYVEESRKNIEQILDELRPPSEGRIYLGGYTNREAAAMRSPFQLPPTESERCHDVAKGADKGFLLIHGLTDSPYLMRSISESLHKAYPCSLIRAVLLPGHGTVAGDSLEMSYKDWKRIVRYGVNSFKNDSAISQVYLVGFSTGTSLAIAYMKEYPPAASKCREDNIKGLILLSTAVKAKSGAAWLTPIAKWFKKWGTTFQEKDAARYESFSLNAGAQFYSLTKDMLDPEYTLDVPVLMAVSADDATIDARAAREFFCYPTEIRRRVLIWYQSIDPAVNASINRQDTPELMCDNIVEIRLTDIQPDFNTVNLAHTALSMSPDDPHYGVHGKYHNCKAYDTAKKTQEFEECRTNDTETVYGENNISKLKDRLHLNYKYLRRGTFNPDYANLEQKILCFTSDTCPAADLTSYGSRVNH